MNSLAEMVVVGNFVAEMVVVVGAVVGGVVVGRWVVVLVVATETWVVEVTGSTDKLDKITDLLSSYGIRELVRTGIIAMARGAKTAGRTGAD